MSDNEFNQSESVSQDEPEAPAQPEVEAVQESQPEPQPEPQPLPVSAEVAQAMQTQEPASDRRTYEDKMKRTRAHLESEKKVRIRIPKVRGPQTVIINGARFNIPANIHVEVPESVALQLEKAEII